MAGWRGTLAQRGSIAIGAFYVFSGVAGLIVNADFGTGAGTSAKQFIVDWNGWHAVLTLLLAVTAFAAATRPRWATAFLAYNVVANATTAIWALADRTPLGILDLPHVATDVALHLAVTIVSALLLAIQFRADRAAAQSSAFT